MAARFFLPNGALNAPLGTAPRMGGNEQWYVDDFLAQWYKHTSPAPWNVDFSTNGDPWINGGGTDAGAYAFAVPVYVVPHATTRVPVQFRDPWASSPAFPHSAQFPTVQDGWWQNELSWRLQQGVPVPSSVLTNPFYAEATHIGGDAGVAIVDDTTNELWEFWLFNVLTDGTVVCGHGGWMPDHTQNGGVFQDVASPYQSKLWGSSATSISITGAQISQQELINGVIPHAIGLDLVGTAWPSDPALPFYVWPAERTDGNNLSPIPEGTRFRLDPTFNTTTITAGNAAATRTARMVAKAMQDYGWIVWDKGGSCALQVEPGSFDWSGGSFPNNILLSIPLASGNVQIVDPNWRPGVAGAGSVAGWRVSVSA
jgi:hypothetical protein